jgi:anti-sigma regulatory factor (Ser/Thr protein kinase)
LPDATEDVLGMLAAYFPPAIARAVLRSTLRRGGLADDRLEAVDLASFASTLEQTLTMYIVDPVRRGECVAKVRRLLPLANMEPTPTPAPRSSPRQTPVRPSADPERRTPVPEVASRMPVPDVAGRMPAPEVASSAPGGVVRVRQASDVVHACDLARATARGVGFTLLDQTKIATAASELARNILLYVGDGELRVAALESPRRGIQISAVDSGAGIADVDLVMSGGYRSRTGMGLGLKGTKRLMDALEIDSRPGRGTTVVARKLLS